MDHLNFMDELRKRNIPLELLRDRFDDTGYDTLEELVTYSFGFHDVIKGLCVWENTPEGNKFWYSVADSKCAEDIKWPDPETPKPEETSYLLKEWFLANYNDGFEICYVDDSGFKNNIPLDGDDYGCTKDIVLAKHLVELHNRTVT